MSVFVKYNKKKLLVSLYQNLDIQAGLKMNNKIIIAFDLGADITNLLKPKIS